MEDAIIDDARLNAFEPLPDAAARGRRPGGSRRLRRLMRPDLPQWEGEDVRRRAAAGVVGAVGWPVPGLNRDGANQPQRQDRGRSRPVAISCTHSLSDGSVIGCSTSGPAQASPSPEVNDGAGFARIEKRCPLESRRVRFSRRAARSPLRSASVGEEAHCGPDASSGRRNEARGFPRDKRGGAMVAFGHLVAAHGERHPFARRVRILVAFRRREVKPFVGFDP